MTKKDFELIADCIKVSIETGATVTGHAKLIATCLAGQNPRFDRARFLAACGVTE